MVLADSTGACRNERAAIVAIVDSYFPKYAKLSLTPYVYVAGRNSQNLIAPDTVFPW